MKEKFTCRVEMQQTVRSKFGQTLTKGKIYNAQPLKDGRYRVLVSQTVSIVISPKSVTVLSKEPAKPTSKVWHYSTTATTIKYEDHEVNAHTIEEAKEIIEKRHGTAQEVTSNGMGTAYGFDISEPEEI